MPVVNSAHIIE